MHPTQNQAADFGKAPTPSPEDIADYGLRLRDEATDRLDNSVIGMLSECINGLAIQEHTPAGRRWLSAALAVLAAREEVVAEAQRFTYSRDIDIDEPWLSGIDPADIEGYAVGRWAR
jgi:hypothetical protein